MRSCWLLVLSTVLLLACESGPSLPPSPFSAPRPLTLSTPVSTTWPQLANTPDRQGYSPTTVTAAVINTGFWTYNFATQKGETVAPGVQPILNGSPLLAFVPTQQGHVYALTTPTSGAGTVTRTFPTSGAIGPIIGTPAATATVLYVPSMDGALYAYTISTGAQLWKCQLSTDYGVGSGVLMDDNATPSHIVVATRDGTLWSVSPSTGCPSGVQWSNGFGSPVMQTPATDGTNVFVGTLDMKMHAVNLSSGSTTWTQGPLDGAGFVGYYPMVVSGFVVDRPIPSTTEYSGDVSRAGLAAQTFDWSFTDANETATLANYDATPSAVSISFHVLSASTGAHGSYASGGVGFSPIHINDVGTHEGSHAPGCVDQNFSNSLEMVFTKDGGLYGSLGFVRISLSTRKILQVEPTNFGAGNGNRDESVTPTCTTNGVIWMHGGENVGDAPWGFSDLTTNPPTWTAMSQNKNAVLEWGYGGYYTPVALAAGKAYHNLWSELSVRSVQ